jgi:hypothetical protein
MVQIPRPWQSAKALELEQIERNNSSKDSLAHKKKGILISNTYTSKKIFPMGFKWVFVRK